MEAGEVVGPSREANISYVRHLGMYLARELTQASLVMIGRMFGGRDHATVHHAIGKIGALAGKPGYAGEVEQVRRLSRDAIRALSGAEMEVVIQSPTVVRGP